MKRIKKYFFLSFIWITIPALTITPELKSKILYNESRLTPYTINVSGYTRSDGTMVSSYSRRPQGAVSHDKPYVQENKRLRTQINLIYFFAVFSIFFLLYFSTKEFKLFNHNYQLHVLNTVIKNMNFHFGNLIYIPSNLMNSNFSSKDSMLHGKCIYCCNSIKKQEFYYYSNKRSSSYSVCFRCMEKWALKYKDQLFYVKSFNIKLSQFITEFKEILVKKYPGFKIQDELIRVYFFKRIKKY